MLRRIFLPLVVPGIVTVALFAFITSWNEFIAALIFMNKETAFTVPIMLVSVRTGPVRRGRLGRAAGGRHRSRSSPACSSTCCCSATTSPAS